MAPKKTKRNKIWDSNLGKKKHFVTYLRGIMTSGSVAGLIVSISSLHSPELPEFIKTRGWNLWHSWKLCQDYVETCDISQAPLESTKIARSLRALMEWRNPHTQILQLNLNPFALLYKPSSSTLKFFQPSTFPHCKLQSSHFTSHISHLPFHVHISHWKFHLPAQKNIRKLTCAIRKLADDNPSVWSNWSNATLAL